MGRGSDEPWEAGALSGAASDNIPGGSELNNLNHLNLATRLSHFYDNNNSEINPYTSINDTKYHDCSDIITRYKDSLVPLILNVNIQSIHSKFGELNDLVTDLINHGVSIVAITLQANC